MHLDRPVPPDELRNAQGGLCACEQPAVHLAIYLI
jgi:hypothetical protein